MRQITAYQTADGQIYPSHEAAMHAAQKRYDDHMTAMRHALMAAHPDLGHVAAGQCLEWIERNFWRIAEAESLRRDIATLDTDED